MLIMARLTCDEYFVMDYSELINPAIIVVDMVNGFIKEGKLSDPYIARTVQPIINLIANTNHVRQDLLFVTDCHQEGCLEFETFPVHCLEGTSESQVIDELKDYVTDTNVFKKNSINTFTAPGFSDWLNAIKAPADLVVTGCCTDLCILQLVLSLQSWINQNEKRNMRVIVPVNCVDTYDAEFSSHKAKKMNKFALKNMEANGIKVISEFVK
ncbi:cysteine hydrolase family protein [Ileibacterium valens]|nr:cysteine hydrolase [Ileibacterium valens]